MSFFKLHEAIQGFQGGYHQRFSDFWQIAEKFESAYTQVTNYIGSGKELEPTRFGTLLNNFLQYFVYFPWTYDHIVTNEPTHVRDATEELKHAFQMYDHMLEIVRPHLKKLGERKQEAVAIFKKNAEEAHTAYDKLSAKVQEVASKPGHDQLSASGYDQVLKKNVEGRKQKEAQAEAERKAAEYKAYHRYDTLMSAKPDERLAAAVSQTTALAWPNNWGGDVEKYVFNILRAAKYTQSMKSHGTLSESDRKLLEQAQKNIATAAAAAKKIVDAGRYGGADAYNFDSATRYYTTVTQEMGKLQQYAASLPPTGEWH